MREASGEVDSFTECEGVWVRMKNRVRGCKAEGEVEGISKFVNMKMEPMG